jgi:cytochrome P450 family 142 subfamily A polypeptide 1
MPTQPTHPTRDDIDLLDGSFYVDNPREKYAWMRANAPVYFDAANGVWAIATYAAILAAEKDPATFSNAGGIRPDTGPIPMMIDMDDPEHWKRRKLVNKGFTPRRVRDSQQEIRDVCDAILDQVCERGECDFVTDIASPLPMILIGDMLGVAPADRDDLLRWSDDMVGALSGKATEAQAMKAMDAMGGYTAFCTHAVAERQAQPTDDLMSVLVHAEVDGDRLSPHDVLHESLLILIGGDETTRHVISGGMEQLLVHPEQWKLLVNDPGKLTVAIEEMLRWVTPIKNMCRTVTHDTEFLGEHLTAGQKCMLMFESANFDEAKFSEPDRFDVERQPNEHVAFGFGTHYCLGQALARLELKVMFERLVARMPDLELAADPTGLPRRRANFISGLESMPVTFSPSRPLARSVL